MSIRRLTPNTTGNRALAALAFLCVLLGLFALASVPASALGIAVDGSTSDVYVVDSASNRIDVFAPTTLADASVEAPAGSTRFFSAVLPEEPVTEPASELTTTTARLNGVLNPGAAGEVGTFEFHYRPNGSECQGEGEGRSAPEPPGATTGEKEEPVSAVAGTGIVGPLSPGTVYSACVLAINSEGHAVEGKPVQFTTRSVPPVLIGESSSPKATSARLEATLVPGGATTYSFEYSTEESGGKLTGTIVKVSGAAPVSGREQTVGAATEALLPNTTYFFRVLLENEATKGTPVTGAVTPFTTAITPETPEGVKAVETAPRTWTLKGVLNPKAAGNPGTFQLLYRLGSECKGESVAEGPATGAQGEIAEKQVTLVPHSSYTVCLRARNAVGEESALSTPLTFSTPVAPPTIEDQSVSDVAATSATFDASVDPQGAASSYQFELAPAGGSFTPVAEPEGHGTIPEGTAPVPVSVHVQHGLAQGGRYQFRVTARNSAQAVTGEPLAFTTQNAGSFALPDGRAWEMVSPPNKEGALIWAIGFATNGGAPFQASADGGAMTY
jgi:hypothetical protein